MNILANSFLLGLDLKSLGAAGTIVTLIFYFLLQVMKVLGLSISLSPKQKLLVFFAFFVLGIFCVYQIPVWFTPQGPQKQMSNPEPVTTGSINKSMSGDPVLFLFSSFQIGRAQSPLCQIVFGKYQINESFSKNSPFYINPGNTSIRIVLLEIDQTKNKAIFEINDNGIKLNDLIDISLGPGESKDFSVKDCHGTLTLSSIQSKTEGFSQLFRTRYSANIILSPKEGKMKMYLIPKSVKTTNQKTQL